MISGYPSINGPDSSLNQSLTSALQNALQTYAQAAQAKNAPAMSSADLALKQAQAKRENAMANLPFGGMNVPGPAGEIVGLEMIRQLYGDNSPQYQLARKSFDLTQQSALSRIGYQNALTGSMPVRYLTPTGKSIVEEENVSQGLQPFGNKSMVNPGGTTPVNLNNLNIPSRAPVGQQVFDQDKANELANQYSLLRQKQTTDVDTRKRNLFATNIEKTLNMINPDHLTQYAGLAGGVKQRIEQGLASTGKESKNYDNYLNARQAVEFLSSQVRQFYGDSIQPAMRERLDRLNDPSTWTTNPKLAKELFNTTKSILGQELQTYRDALKSRSPYSNLENAQPSSTAGRVRHYNVQTGSFE